MNIVISEEAHKMNMKREQQETSFPTNFLTPRIAAGTCHLSQSIMI